MVHCSQESYGIKSLIPNVTDVTIVTDVLVYRLQPILIK